MLTHHRGLLDTNVVVHLGRIDPEHLPLEAAISTVTLAELSAGPHYALDPNERARRLETLQRTEAAFDAIPFSVDAARIFGRMSAAVLAAGRTPRRRVADLMIAASAAAESIPLYTTNIDDFRGLEGIVQLVEVIRPH